MRASHAPFAATIVVGLFLAAACSSAAPSIPVVTPTPPASSATPAPTPTSSPTSTPTPPATPTPLITPIPAPTGPPTVSPTTSLDAIRVVDLTAILDIESAERYETFGDKPILLERVWSPNDTGLGGTCIETNVPWLACLNLIDWYVLPVAEGAGCPAIHTESCYDGPALEILYQPGLGERLDLGDGPVDLIGHFGDPASELCRAEIRAACRDRFVVTAIEPTGR
jgi:hypothetical protein